MTYGELKELIKKYLHRSDLNNYIPTWLKFTHRLIQCGKLFCYQQKTFDPIDLTTSQDTYTLPSDLKRIEAIVVKDKTTNQYVATLDYKPSPQFYHEAERIKNQYDYPVIYKKWSNSITVKPDVGSDDRYQMIIEGYYELPFYSNDDDTDYLSENYPMLLVFGTLLHAESFIINDKRINLWAEMFKQHYQTYLNEETVIAVSDVKSSHLE